MNTKNVLFALLGIVILTGVGVLLLGGRQSSRDYKNITYMIDGQAVTLHDGLSEIAQVGSAAKIVTRYFGNDAQGDLNGDGIPDLAFLLTQTSGGSGTFYYVVGAIQHKDGSYSGTDGVLLGDRIAPQPTEIRDGKVIANYADRAPSEPMTTSPSVGKSLLLKLDPVTMQFGIVVQNFEGEVASPKIPTADESIPTNVTLSGTYACLPFIDTAKPTTEECVFGLKADDGQYYMVNFGQSAIGMEQFKKREHITAEGFVVIKEALSTDQWMKYNMKGIFTITKLIASTNVKQ